MYRDEFNLSPTIYSPCGQDTVLNVNTAVRVDNSGNSAGSGFITNDSVRAVSCFLDPFNCAYFPED